MSRTLNLKNQLLNSALVAALGLLGLETLAAADTTVAYRGQIYTLYRDNQGQPLVYGNSDRSITALGGTLISDPVGVEYSGELYIFGIGTDSSLFFTTIDRQPWTNLGGVMSRILRVFNTGYDVAIDVVGSDGFPYERTLNAGWVRLPQVVPPAPGYNPYPQPQPPRYNPEPPRYNPQPQPPRYNPEPPRYNPYPQPGGDRGGDNRGGDNRGGGHGH